MRSGPITRPASLNDCHVPPRSSRAWLPRTTPPTAAASSTIEVISNASRWSVRNSVPDLRGAPEARADVRRPRQASARLQPDRRPRSRPSSRRPRRLRRAPASSARPPTARRRAARGRRSRTGTSPSPRRRRRAPAPRRRTPPKQQVEDGQRAEVPDQRERRVERVREADDRDARAEAGERGDEPDDPDEDVAHYEIAMPCRPGSACRRGSGRRPARA